DRARRDDHRVGLKAAAREGRGEIALVVDDVGEAEIVLLPPRALVGDRRLGAGRHDQVGLDVLRLLQGLEHADAVDRAGGTRDPDDDPPHAYVGYPSGASSEVQWPMRR